MSKMSDLAVDEMNREKVEFPVLGKAADAEMYRFLDRVRAQGYINMMLAPAKLRRAFGLTRDEARTVFFRWCDRHGAHVR